MGSKVEEILMQNNCNVKFKKFAYPDEFIIHGDIKELEKKYNVDDDYIYNYSKQMVSEKDNKYIKKIVTRSEKCIKTIKRKIRLMICG